MQPTLPSIRWAVVIGAVVAFFAVFAIRHAAAGMGPQPHEIFEIKERMIDVIPRDPTYPLQFLGADVLFIFGYSLAVFGGVVPLAAQRSPVLAYVGAALFALATFTDLFELSLYGVGAVGQLKHTGDGIVPTWASVVSVLRLNFVFTACGILGIALPRRNFLEWALSLSLGAALVMGAVSVAMPKIGGLRGLPFLALLPLVAIYYARRQPAAEAA